MPRKQLTVDVAKEIAAHAENGTLKKAVIRKRVSGKNKGLLFADYVTQSNGEPDVYLAQVLQEVAELLEQDDALHLVIMKKEARDAIAIMERRVVSA